MISEQALDTAKQAYNAAEQDYNVRSRALDLARAQLVVTLKPRRRRANGLHAIASCTVSDSSVGVKPRITETTPS